MNVCAPNLRTVSTATRVRHRVVALAVVLAIVTYFDRACMATLAPKIMWDLGLSKDQMSLVFSAFALAYAAFEIPTAWWADRVGVRRVLTRIVLWWSIFTTLTATVFNFASLIIVNLLFGAGEAGAFPSVARAFSRWVPRSERGKVQGVFFSGAHLAAGLTPILVIALTQIISWRAVFAWFGLLGVVWATVWYRWFRDDPAEHRAVNAAELNKIIADRLPVGAHIEGWAFWKRLLGHRNTPLLCGMYFPNCYAFYFCITWLPTYLKEEQGFHDVLLGVFAGMPLILCVLGDLTGGVTTDAVAKRYGLRIGRTGVGAIGYFVASVAIIGAGAVHQPMLAATLIALALAASMFTLGASWATCLDIGGDHAGVVSAAMNTSGQIGSIVSPLMATWLLRRFNDWNAPLFVMGGLFLVGAVCWCFIDPNRKVCE
jgi:MFS family permease